MLARSVRTPLMIGIGTGFALVTGAVPAVLADKTPTPSSGTTATSPSTGSGGSPGAPPATPSPTEPTKTPPAPPKPPPGPTLSVAFQHVPGSVSEGASSSLFVQVIPHIPKDAKAPAGVVLHVGSSRAKATFESNGSHTYKIATLSFPKLVAVTVSVPGGVSTGKIDVWAQADATNTPQVVAKPSLSLPVKKKPKSTHSGGSSTGSKGGTGSNSTSSGATSSLGNLNTTGLNTGLNTTGPNTTGQNKTGNSGSTTDEAPQTAASLPDIAQDPSTAPLQNVGSSESMRGTGEDTPLAFNKLVSTQAAWLAALLVAFSLLLTQIRLGRATAKGARPKRARRGKRRGRAR